MVQRPHDNKLSFEALRVARDRIELVSKRNSKPETSQSLIVILMILTDIMKHYLPTRPLYPRIAHGVKAKAIYQLKMGVSHKIVAGTHCISLSTVRKLVKDNDLFRKPDRRRVKEANGYRTTYLLK